MKDGAAPRADVGIKSRRNGRREYHKRVEGSCAKRTKGAKRKKGAQRWTKWHENGQFGTEVDKMAGMEGLARRLQYSG